MLKKTLIVVALSAVSALSFAAESDARQAAKQVVDLQDGWIKNYDDMGNLTFFAEDRSGALLFRVIEAGPGETMPSNLQMAEVIPSVAGAQPPGPGQKTTFAGAEAESFASTLSAEGVPPIALNVVIRKVGDRHIAVGVTMIPQTTDAAGRQKVESQFARVTIPTR